jgi:hypothetical protein
LISKQNSIKREKGKRKENSSSLLKKHKEGTVFPGNSHCVVLQHKPFARNRLDLEYLCSQRKMCRIPLSGVDPAFLTLTHTLKNAKKYEDI